MTEVWRPIKSLPGMIASSEGRVMVTPYFGSMPYGGQRPYGGQPIYGVWNNQELRYQIYHKGRVYKVARLVCEAFHGSPEKDQVCMHIDEDSRNNSPDNLRWATQKENLNSPKFLEYCRSRTGENSPYIKGRKK